MNLNIIISQILLLAVLCLTACQKEEETIPLLNGTWVEIDTTYTIIFRTNSITGSFLLNRGYETRDGYYLPKMGSGPYYYEISQDNINIVNQLSGIKEGFNYYFEFNESSKTFKIGVFSFFDTDKAILIFKKVD